MATTTQQNRPLQITTPLGKDVLLISGFWAEEAISKLFQFQADLWAETGKEVSFDQLLGQTVTVQMEIAEGRTRHFSGIVNRVFEGDRDQNFTRFRIDIVPKFWLLTKRVQSRIFQHQTIPDILKRVLEGLDVAWEIQGTFHPRDYCVQYRESDFDFASRLMEEEGIFYFFKHADGAHKMVVANTPTSHSNVVDPKRIVFAPSVQLERSGFQVEHWEKMQELRSGKVTLWDHCFEMPHKHLEAERAIQDSVAVGKVAHKLKVGGNDRLEQYDWPGGYAQRFDGVDRGGAAKPSDLQKIFEDNKRTTEIRMQQEAVPGLVMRGEGISRNFAAGHAFTLTGHPHADGDYVLTSVRHEMTSGGDFRSERSGYHYRNQFTCIPTGLPFRPQRVTPRPFVRGSQTAVVVGPAGEEIFCDKYGRIKVQFHWDREGKNDADSSCWVRVGTPWAGKQWGMIHLPRVGQEVIVDFLEGDPDQPIVVGSVYNAEMMPPYSLPDHKTQSGVKSRSSLNGTSENFNEIRFEDKKGEEEIYFHAEKDYTQVVENDRDEKIGHDRTLVVGHNKTETVHNDKTIHVKGDEKTTIDGSRAEEVKKDETIKIGKNRKETVGDDEGINVGGNRQLDIGKNLNVSIQGDRTESIGKSASWDIKGAMTVIVDKDWVHEVKKNVTITAGDKILLTCGNASVLLKKDGTIEVNGKTVNVKATGDVKIKGAKIGLN
jgi:type VI secretion system secreted protein VgrG